LTDPAREAATEDGREVIEPITGSLISILGEGDCRTASVAVEMPGSGDETLADEVTYSFDEQCNVKDIIGRKLSYQEIERLEHLDRDNSDSSRLFGATGGEGGEVESALTLYGNWIHSSQTMQDVVNIDIAKFQYHTDRVWDGSNSWYKTGSGGSGPCVCPWWMRSSTSVTWNHPVGYPYQSYHDTKPQTYASSLAGGNFHSDFLWCNFQAGQNYTMENTHVSNYNGGYTAYFYQNRACSGTHMATRKWTNTDDEW